MSIAPTLVRERLADPQYRKHVAAMMRRRVSPSEAEDLTQSVLCDVLASTRAPSEESELRRFVCVVARNKVVDFHRRAYRYPSTDLDGDAMVAPVESSRVEARALLQRVVSDASPRDRETLEWLVREHEGEELAEIAVDVGVPAPTVRQRVSRLRRALRAQWAHVFALLVLTCSGGAAVRHYTNVAERGGIIVADPSGDPGARVFGLAQGTWRIEDGTRIEGASFDARLAEVRVTGRTVEISSPVRVATRTVSGAVAVDANTYSIELVDENGKGERATIVLGVESMTVTLHEGRLRGTAKLTRK